MSAPSQNDEEVSIAADMLRSGYERWQRLEEEKAAIGEDLKELFAELKANGFAPKALRESFRRVRNIDDASQKEHDAVVDLYVASLTGARPAYTREDDLPDHDAETGEIIKNTESGMVPAPEADQPPRTASASVPHSEPTSNGTDAPTSPGAAEETVPSGSSAPNSQAKATEAEPDEVQSASPDGVASRLSDGSGTVAPISSPVVDHYALDTADLDPARVLLANCIECRARIYEGDDHHVVGPNEEFYCSACGSDSVATNSPTGDAAEGTGGVTHPPLVSTRRQWQHSDPPHPMCKRPDGPRGCGGFSNLALCVECREAAGGQIVHGDPPDMRVLN